MKHKVSLALISALYLTSCTWNVSTVPLRGELAGQQITTTVDAAIASYYVESYLARAGYREDWDVWKKTGTFKICRVITAGTAR